MRPQARPVGLRGGQVDGQVGRDAPGEPLDLAAGEDVRGLAHPPEDDDLRRSPGGRRASSPSIGITAAIPVPVAAKTMSPGWTASRTKKPCGPVMFTRVPMGIAIRKSEAFPSGITRMMKRSTSPASLCDAIE